MLHRLIEERLQSAVAKILPEINLQSIVVRPCPDPKFGDYQSNALMAVAKERKLNPRRLAEEVLLQLVVSDFCEKVEIAGPGFLNFRLSALAVAKVLADAAQGKHFFFQKTDTPRTIVIDFSSPNVAKPMHVGHIRSTVLGDALSRILRFLGHRVVTDNHIGDWGTQFGMLIVGWKMLRDESAFAADPLAELERIYKVISAECDETKPGAKPETRERARAELVQLQQGDPENLAIWKEMIRVSEAQFNTIYQRLGITFDHTLGESFYNPQLQQIVDDLLARRVARESEGAICIFAEESDSPRDNPFFIQKDGELKANPFVIQKRDGGFNYATTDLATLRYRIQTWHPQEIVYVTDGRQQLHFRQLFAAFARWEPQTRVKLAHVWFGSILGEDGRPFKTRAGDTVRLAALLDEAEERAYQVVTEKNLELPEEKRREVARVVGLGSVKYADLSQNRQSDYVFSWEKMLALQGNTAPYLQYAYTRVQSIFRKGNAEEPGEIILSHTAELNLAKHLLKFGMVLEAVVEDYRPNYLCTFLYELAGYFSSFYECCPVLKAEVAERKSRLALCRVTAAVLKQGLELLGIETTEEM